MFIKRLLIASLACVAAIVGTTCKAQDLYTPAPLQLLAERVDQHDLQIAELQSRVDSLEQAPKLRTKEVQTGLKTTEELQSELEDSWTDHLYGRMARGQESMVYQHLVQTHGYAPDQVDGLSLDEATMLHNLAHSKSHRLAAHHGSSAPVKRTVSASRMNCANGQCSRARSTTWRPFSFLRRRLN